MDVSINDGVPFSSFGSYMTFSVLPKAWGHAGLVLRTMHGEGGGREAFHMRLMAGDRETADYAIAATPTVCTLTCPEGEVRIAFASPDCAVLRGTGVGLRLRSLGSFRGHDAFPVGDGLWSVNASANGTHYLLRQRRGTLSVDAPHWVRTQDKPRQEQPPDRPGVVADLLPDSDGVWEAVICEDATSPRAVLRDVCFEDALRRSQKMWDDWLATTPPVPNRFAESAARAMYVNYASAVRPCGFLHRDTILMSKNWMTHCWSWDHCFNAIAHAAGKPNVAWDQLNVHFDLQDSNGCLPDGVNAEDAGWGYCKPPIHGWALDCMTRLNPELLTAERCAEFYPKLAAWTNWWLRERDSDDDGLAEYHHGNDSGWDNGTVFDLGYPVAGADLAAFLIVQMDVLADLARRQGHDAGAADWTARADAMLAAMMARLWDGDQFRGRKAHTCKTAPGDCLINYMPLLLGKRLPENVRAELATALTPGGRFVTDFGPATESPSSLSYVPDGYWRGPIWGSETVLIADGLRRSGFPDLAREIGQRYCKMCQACGTFAENYNALTGEPLRDPAYTWGSSAFIILARDL